MKDISEYADAHLRIFPRPSPPAPDSISSVHLIGICGTGMGSLAGLFSDAGYNVQGSDAAAYPPMSTRLRDMNILVFEGYHSVHLNPTPDLVVVGNACTPTHAEAAFARDNDFVQLSLPEAVKHFFLNGKKSVVVAGTHGKTTTTGLVVHAFSRLGMDPGYLVGGVLRDRNSSYSIGGGKYFVIEGDEYDSAYFDKRPKFMHYQPHVGIITSLEYDHVDIYDDFEDYVSAFRSFASIVDPEGVLILNGDDPAIRELASHTTASVMTYGLTEDVDTRATNVRAEADVQHFDLIIDGAVASTVTLPMNGRHNVSNTLAAISAALACGASPEDVSRTFATFEGLKRRQEIVLNENGVTVIDDFAHHPTAVEETLRAIRQRYPDNRVIGVFEPRSNSSRRKVFENPYIDAFSVADQVIISSPPFRHNDNQDDFMDITNVVNKICDRGIPAVAFEDFEDLFHHLSSSIVAGDVILIMSNGGFNGIHQKLSEYIQSEMPVIGSSK